MLSRRTFLAVTGGSLAGSAGCIGSPEVGEQPTAGAFDLSSSAITEGQQIPDRYTCHGADTSPPLSIAGVPEGTESLALVLEDPDAPAGTFVHWLLWNIPPERTSIPEALPRNPSLADLGGAAQGTNDFGEIGYGGPCPPGEETHTYRFVLSALESKLGVEPGEGASVVRPVIEENRIGFTRFSAPYG